MPEWFWAALGGLIILHLIFIGTNIRVMLWELRGIRTALNELHDDLRDVCGEASLTAAERREDEHHSELYRKASGG